MGKKFGLGKGLSALIPEEISDSIDSSNQLFIDINKIKCDSNQPRKSFDVDKITELAESIKIHGVIQPLILRKENESYVIVAGERRWRAAKLAGIKEVPAVVMELDRKEILEISLIENIQRQDLNPIEEAEAYKRLIEDFDLTQEELSKRIGKSRTAITNTMRLVNLDNRVQQYIVEEVISEGHGRCLLAIENGDLQYKLAQRVIDEKLSVRELERIVKNNKQEKSSFKSKNLELNPYYNEIRNQLQEHFGTKVNFSTKKDKGKIEIEYYSQDDLQRILDIINL